MDNEKDNKKWENRDKKTWYADKSKIGFDFEHPYHSIVMFCRFIRFLVFTIYYYIIPASWDVIDYDYIEFTIVILVLLPFVYKFYKWYKKQP